MKLKSGTPGWPELTAATWSYPTLEQDLDCEVVVVGAGMSGALISYELVSKGIHTVTVDKRQVGAGSTCANTGLLQFCNDKPLRACMHTFGRDNAVRFYTLCKQAVEKLSAIHDSLMTKAELVPRSSLYLASTSEDVKEHREEFKLLQQHGFDVEWWDQAQIETAFGFVKPAAIVTHGDAEVNPYAFVHALFETSTKRYGLQLYEHTRIERREDHDQHIVLITDKGFRIKASHVVYAMGYETQEMKRDQNAVLESSFALVTKPVEGLEEAWPQRMLIWETARPYKYFRTTPDQRIVGGGFDFGSIIPEERERMLHHTTKRLESEIAALFPKLHPIEAEYSWSAVFGSTHDGYPMIGMHPKYPRSTFIEGYGGNGTVYCAIATDIIPALIKTGFHPDAHLFQFERPHYPSSP